MTIEHRTRVNLTPADAARKARPETNETPRERVLRVLKEAEDREAAGLPRENFGLRFRCDAQSYQGESFEGAWELAWDVVNVYEPVERPPCPMSIEGANKLLAKRMTIQARLAGDQWDSGPRVPPVIQEWIDGEWFPA